MIKRLANYLLDNSKSNSSFHSQLNDVLSGSGDVGLVLSERVVNIPPAVAAPSYKMLLEEMQWAIEDASAILETLLKYLARTL